MRKIKVLEFVDSIQYGGVEQVVYNYISNLDQNKYEFSIITTGKRYPDAEERFNKLGVKIYGLPLKKENFIKYLLELNSIIRNGNFDVIHSHINFYSFIPLLFAKFYGIKIKISHVHGIFNNKLSTRIMEKITSMLANVRLSCSKEAGLKFYKKYKFSVLHNGINTKVFAFDEKVRKQVRRKYGFNNDDVVLGHIGRFYSVKNHLFIIDMFSKLKKYNKNYKLMLIGEGELLSSCIQRVKQLGLEKDVIFVKPIPDVYKFYQCFDIFILPSISEGFGVVVLEAQCCGLKCIVSTGVPKEINVTGNVTFLPINDTNIWIKKLISIDYHNDRIIEKNKIIDSGFDISSSINKLDLLYSSKEKGE